MSRRDNDIKAPDGFLLGGLRTVRRDGTILLGRGYYQCPVEWAGERRWCHIPPWGDFHHLHVSTEEDLHIFRAVSEDRYIEAPRTERPDAKPCFRRASYKAWAEQCGRDRDRDGAEGGDANAAPVPQDRQARAEGIAQNPEPKQ